MASAQLGTRQKFCHLELELQTALDTHGVLEWGLLVSLQSQQACQAHIRAGLVLKLQDKDAGAQHSLLVHQGQQQQHSSNGAGMQGLQEGGQEVTALELVSWPEFVLTCRPRRGSCTRGDDWHNWQNPGSRCLGSLCWPCRCARHYTGMEHVIGNHPTACMG